MNDGGNPPVTTPDPIRSLELLWGVRAPATRGPKPGLTIDEVVNAAIAIADVDGLAGLSMRRVADRLDVGTMSLYRYVPAKAELLDLMFDRVSNETARPEGAADGWRGTARTDRPREPGPLRPTPVAPGPREFPSAARSRRDRQVRLRVAGHRRHRPVRCGDGFGARAPPRVRPERGRIARHGMDARTGRDRADRRRVVAVDRPHARAGPRRRAIRRGGARRHGRRPRSTAGCTTRPRPSSSASNESSTASRC